MALDHALDLVEESMAEIFNVVFDIESLFS